MNDQCKSSYAIIPSYILDDENLDEGAKTLYARISMYSQEGRCWASNKHFAEKQKVEIRTIQKWLAQLKNEGYITIDVDSSGYQTKRDIWLTSDFKKFSKGCTTNHPSLNYNSPPPVPKITQINTSKINIKEQEKAASAIAPAAKERENAGAAEKKEELVEREPDIPFTTSKGERKTVSQSEIYRHFAKSHYKTEIIKEAIAILKNETAPINNPLKFLESICLRLASNPPKRLKYSSNPEISINAPPKLDCAPTNKKITI